MTSHIDKPRTTPLVDVSDPDREPDPPTRTLLEDSIDRHPTALGRRLDNYLAAVARALESHGVITGSPQRTDPGHRLIGSIVIDCTALRVAALRPADAQDVDQRALGGAGQPSRPTPVIVTWDENMGWCAGLHHDPAHSSQRYLHPHLLPAPDAVAEFVVGLALGRPLGSSRPIATATQGPPRLRLIR